MCLCIVTIFSVMLTYKKYNPILSCIYPYIIILGVYFIHIFFTLYIPKSINIHLLHHSSGNLHLFIELFTNFIWFLIFYFINYFLLCGLIPNILIFFTMIIYLTTHIINYSMLGQSKIHILHDKRVTCNYGPDGLDHLFGTNCDEQVENYDHIIPNVFFAFFITWFIFRPKIF